MRVRKPLRLQGVQLETFRRLYPIAEGVARRLAPRFQQRFFDAADALQHCLIGLAQAVATFDPGRGATLEDYCSFCCRARCLDAYRVIVGRPGRRKRGPMLATAGSAKLDARECGYEDGGAAAVDLADECRTLLSGFPARSRAAARLYFWDGLTMAQVGRVLNLSESRICQLFREMRSVADGFIMGTGGDGDRGGDGGHAGRLTAASAPGKKGRMAERRA